MRLSTVYRLFAGFGCGLSLIPLSPLSADRLERRTDELYWEGSIPRRKRYPRR